MVRFISLLILAGVLVMVQPFDGTEPGHLGPAKEKVMTDDDKQQRVQIKAAQQPEMKQRVHSLRDELVDSLKFAKINQSASHLIVDAIIEANNPMARSFPVDESIYDQQGESEQPLEALNELDMEQELESAGFNVEQNQIIIDGIAEANFYNR